MYKKSLFEKILKLNYLKKIATLKQFSLNSNFKQNIWKQAILYLSLNATKLVWF